jgi:hypothetical protein
MSKHFRFEDLKIWQKAVSIANRLFEIKNNLYAELEELSRMITGFQRAL